MANQNENIIENKPARNSTTRFIFIRHGETNFNKEKKVMGQFFDDPLNKEGVFQINKILSKLTGNFDTIYSSPLKRTSQAALILGKHLKIPVKFADGLKQRDFGLMSGKTWEEIGKKLRGRDFDPEERLKYNFRPYGGESFSDFKLRVLNFIKYTKKKHSNEKIIAVTHSGVVRLMYYLFSPKSNVKKVEQASIHEFDI